MTDKVEEEASPDQASSQTPLSQLTREQAGDCPAVSRGQSMSTLTGEGDTRPVPVPAGKAEEKVFRFSEGPSLEELCVDLSLVPFHLLWCSEYQIKP